MSKATDRSASIIIFLLAVVLGYLAGHHRAGTKYQRLAAVVDYQNSEAARTLAELTTERDDLQAQLDLFAKHQENKDAQALAEIERLDTELRNRPVRVRIVTEAGPCSGGASSETAAGTEGGGANAGQAYGLLPDANSRRLAAALKEVETLSAAYSSCKSALYSDRALTQ